MRKVLLISYNFPPVGGAGVQRPVKFVKYLRDCGWEPVVMTVSNPSVPVYDTGLLNDIPQGVRVYSARTLEPSYASKKGLASEGKQLKSVMKSLLKRVVAQFILPDLQILWWPDLLVKLVKVIRKEGPQILFVSAPPFSSFLPVCLIGRVLRVPVVLDYRDEWAFSRDHWENAVKHLVAKRLDCLLEGLALKSCSAFTAANRSYLSSICSAYPSVQPHKGFVITNGYDEDDFAGNATGVARDDKQITIVYTGTVWKATSLRSFVTALKKLLRKHPSLKEVLKVKVFGRVLETELEYFQDEDVSQVVSLLGYVPHSAVTKETKAADVLLITLSNLQGAGKIITGKAFEYMATGNHILAVTPDGETRMLLANNYNKLSVADADDVDAICAAVLHIVRNITAVRATAASDVTHFSRRTLTSGLAAVFDTCTQT